MTQTAPEWKAATRAATLASVPHAFKRGDHVEVCVKHSEPQRWCLGWVSDLAPYRGRPGYYVNWLPTPKESWESSGGWHPEHVLRAGAAVDA